ncbi:PREDICTED: p53 and DNA damage-regulated protein 1 [Ficedula albicollis]|uniref:p53 and DNA damage-regulated protein 1 n=1 Tax=Ficedula albicollis TaxID=59894 RepID=UPI0003598CA3|nr:PREDICTED: p53 and DNA damage-regulated protein 1 [Ficedula albicollis]
MTSAHSEDLPVLIISAGSPCIFRTPFFQLFLLMAGQGHSGQQMDMVLCQSIPGTSPCLTQTGGTGGWLRPPLLPLSIPLQIVDLDVKRNRNREALRALHKDPEPDDKAMVCFGNMFIELPKAKTREMLRQDQEELDEEINNLRKELRVKVNRLYEAQGKPELKGFNLNPMSAEEMKLINRILES